MNIAIIGTGNVGGALAQRLIEAGHNVLMGAKYPLSEKSIRLATLIGEDRIATIDAAAKQAEVIIVTTPPDAVLQVSSQLGSVEGKTLIDATNSIRVKPDNYPTAYHALKAITKSDAIVKCFNSTGYENMRNPIYNGEGIDMFCAGDDMHAKMIAEQLAKDIGFASCYDFGGDDKVDLLERFAFSWINLAIMQGHGRDIAFKVIRR
ncbi:MAG: NAD(P)-binding domain-containing protein [Candidatus Kapabacteria bacterium]|nr:NAD(P)-binding domain-containing protein [Candidatus Kapabacteria bacterium]